MPMRLFAVLTAFLAGIAVWAFLVGVGPAWAGLAIFSGLLSLILGMEAAR